MGDLFAQVQNCNSTCPPIHFSLSGLGQSLGATLNHTSRLSSVMDL